MDLHSLRAEIDSIDTELLTLFLRRMGIVEQVARYKLDNGLTVLHPHREAEILARREAEAGEKMAAYTREYFQALLAVSRHMQEDIIAKREKKNPDS